MKRKNNLSTKTKILQTALDLYSISGYAGVSIRTLAKNVGVRESSIYNHFSSKKEILRSVLKKFKQPPIDGSVLDEELLDLLPQPKKFFDSFVLRTLEYWNQPQQRKVFRLILLESINQNDVGISLPSYNTESVNLIKIIFDQLIKYSYIKKYDSELLSKQYYSMLNNIRFEYLLETKPDFEKCKNEALSINNLFWEFIKK